MIVNKKLQHGTDNGKLKGYSLKNSKPLKKIYERKQLTYLMLSFENNVKIIKQPSWIIRSSPHVDRWITKSLESRDL